MLFCANMRPERMAALKRTANENRTDLLIEETPF
jgi:hypothetical protein